MVPAKSADDAEKAQPSRTAEAGASSSTLSGHESDSHEPSDAVSAFRSGKLKSFPGPNAKEILGCDAYSHVAQHFVAIVGDDETAFWRGMKHLMDKSPPEVKLNSNLFVVKVLESKDPELRVCKRIIEPMRKSG